MKNVLVDKVRLNKQKKGFNASINSLVDLNNPEVLKNVFDKNSPVAEYVNLKKFKDDMNFKEIPNHISKFIFSMIGTQFFLENN